MVSDFWGSVLRLHRYPTKAEIKHNIYDGFFNCDASIGCNDYILANASSYRHVGH